MITEDDIPIGETKILNDNGVVKQIYTRTNEDDGIYEMLDSQTGKQVLKAITSKNEDKNSIINYIDKNFWTIKVNGKVMDELPSSHKGSEIDNKNKIINITT